MQILHQFLFYSFNIVESLSIFWIYRNWWTFWKSQELSNLPMGFPTNPDTKSPPCLISCPGFLTIQQMPKTPMNNIIYISMGIRLKTQTIFNMRLNKTATIAPITKFKPLHLTEAHTKLNMNFTLTTTKISRPKKLFKPELKTLYRN